MSGTGTALSGTLFEKAYSLFGIGTDEELILRMGQIFLIYTVVVCVYGFLQPAPYGRHSATTGIFSWICRPLVNARLSWMIQELPACVVPAILLFQSKASQLSNMPNLILVILFITHYVQRSIIYPLRMTTGRAKPSPLPIVLFAAIFCIYNGLLQGHHLLNVHQVKNSSVFFIPGVVLFIIGMTINIHHDGILVSLKQKTKKSTDGSGKSDYQIPHGFLFEYISGANYFGEILEWWGFAVASGAYPQFLFAVFTTLFLGGRAIHHHQFYRKTFGKSYPHSRKAVIPFIL